MNDDKPKCKECQRLDTVRLQIKGAGYCPKKRHLRSLKRRADTCRDFIKRGENNVNAIQKVGGNK